MGIKTGELQDDGRIPFRVRFGVTGHRDLKGKEPELAPLVREQLRAVLSRLNSSQTSFALTAISQLAAGADRLVPREVKAEAAARGQEARLECYLPLPHAEYVGVQKFDSDLEREFDDLRHEATVVREPAAGTRRGATSEAYRSAGHLLVGRCDVLIALWDGLPARGRGGTAEIVTWAAARSKPCIWIESGGEHEVRHNLEPDSGRSFFEEVKMRSKEGIEWCDMEHPRSVLEPMRDALRLLDQYNRERAPSAFLPRLVKELLRPKGLAIWVAPAYVRATVLAARWRWRFEWSARLITALAASGAVMLGIGLSYGEEAEIWAYAEAAMFGAALLGLLAVRRLAFHQRWISYRVLAEHLRSAHYLALAGADFRRQARLEPVYGGKEPTSWLMRAFEEVWDRRPLHPTPPAELPPAELQQLRDRLTKDWIEGQIDYHDRNGGDHERWHKIQSVWVLLLFVGTIAFAIMHAFHTLDRLPILFSIVLPAAGASLGVLMTVNQHHALAERSASMKSDLSLVQQKLADSPADSLDRVSSEAARTVAQETEAWFGSMWFLDIEHP